MNRWAIVVVSGIVAFVVALAVDLSLKRATVPTEPDRARITYQRILDSKTIRCGYVLDPPGTIRDPNNGKMSGVVPEALEEAAKNIGYKIDWAEEVGYSTMVQGLLNDRYDAICAATYANSVRAQFTEATQPLYYTSLGIYVRANDHRFDGNLSAISAPGVKLAVLDGEITSIIAKQDFPKAGTLSLPQNSDLAQVLLNVVESKADATFVEPFLADQFLKSHPGSVRNIAVEHPIRTYANVMLVKKRSYELLSLINAMISDVENSESLGGIVAKYDGGRRALYPVAVPYRIPTTSK